MLAAMIEKRLGVGAPSVEDTDPIYRGEFIPGTPVRT